MKRAVIWDMDGTLVDSREFHWRSWLEAMEAEGITITRERFDNTFGQRNDTIIPGWLGADVSAERIQRIGDAKEEAYRSIVRREGLEPAPGAAEWIKRLHADGWLQAIGTSAPSLNAEVVLEVIGVSRYFDAITGGEHVQRGKPDPQVFLTAASRLSASPDQCIVVEDALAGIEAARRAGMRCIGVGDIEAIQQADITVARLTELAEGAFRGLLLR